MATFTSVSDAVVGGFGFFSQAHFNAPYQLYRAFSRYSYRSGKVMMPVAAAAPVAGLPSVASRVVQLAQPYGHRLYTWAVERQGAPPLLPDPTSPRPDNEEFLDGDICPYPPVVDATGGIHIYFVEGWYKYGLLVPMLNGSRYVQGTGLLMDVLRAGGTPYDTTSPDANVYTPDSFIPLQ